MRLRMAVSVLGLCLCALTPQVVSADGMRCGKNLVRNGHRTYEVRALCGPPSSAVQRVAALTGATVEEWTYDFGPREFVRLLRFENDILVKVELAGYGKAR